MGRRSRRRRNGHVPGLPFNSPPALPVSAPADQIPWFEDVDITKKYIGKVKMRPSTARVILDTRLDANLRKGSVNRAHVESLIEEWRNGRWDEDSPDRLWFILNGDCSNGQHRLEFIASLVGEVEYVVIGIETCVNLKSRDHADSHTVRRLRHRVPLSKSQSEARNIEVVLNTYNRLMTGRTMKLPPAVAMEIFEKHHDAIMFAVSYVGRREKFTSAPVLAALMEMYEIDQSKARAFAESLVKMDGPVQPARLLRDNLLRTSYTELRDRLTIYNMSVSAMRAALEGRRVATLYGRPKSGSGRIPWFTANAPLNTPARRHFFGEAHQ